MKHRAFAAALSLVFAANAWSQSPPNGTYQFISGPGTGYGNPPFTVTGGSLIGGGLGGFAGGIHIPNCSGFHVHGVFSGNADPNSGGCGHGIIALFGGGAGSVPGAGALSNLLASSAANQLALTRPGFSPYGFSPEQERMDLLALQQERARQDARSFTLPRTELPMFRNAVLSVINAPSGASQASDANRASNEEPGIADVLKNLPPPATTAAGTPTSFGSNSAVTVADARAARARSLKAESRFETANARAAGASAEARQLADAAARARAAAENDRRRSEAARIEAKVGGGFSSFSLEILEKVAKDREAAAQRSARAAADAAEAAEFAAARAARLEADGAKARASRDEAAEAALVAEAAAGDPRAIEDLKRQVQSRNPANVAAAEAAFAAMLKAAPSNVTMAPTVDLSNVTVDLGDLVFKATSASAGMPRISN